MCRRKRRRILLDRPTSICSSDTPSFRSPAILRSVSPRLDDSRPRLRQPSSVPPPAWRRGRHGRLGTNSVASAATAARAVHHSRICCCRTPGGLAAISGGSRRKVYSRTTGHPGQFSSTTNPEWFVNRISESSIAGTIGCASMAIADRAGSTIIVDPASRNAFWGSQQAWLSCPPVARDTDFDLGAQWLPRPETVILPKIWRLPPTTGRMKDRRPRRLPRHVS